MRTGISLLSHDHLVHCKLTLRKAQIAADKLRTKKGCQLSLTVCQLLKTGVCQGLLRVSSQAGLQFFHSHLKDLIFLPLKFRDQLAIRYKQEPVAMPAVCDGRGEAFSLQHGLDCKKRVW